MYLKIQSIEIDIFQVCGITGYFFYFYETRKYYYTFLKINKIMETQGAKNLHLNICSDRKAIYTKITQKWKKSTD
jgi:hypothetical protein